MGCCKSQEISKDTKDTLLQNDSLASTLADSNNNTRGLSLQKNYSPFQGFIASLTSNNDKKKDSDDEEEGHNPSEPYEPPIIPVKPRIFHGKSIIKPPNLEELKRSEWINKRGHLVKNWKNRYIVLAHEEISYYDKCDAKGNGSNIKGQIHLLGAKCELKILNQKKSPTIWVVEVVSKQEDNKDLLLSFELKQNAYDWYDAISWTIYLINNRYINLIHLRPPTHSSSSSSSSSSSHQPTPLHRDIEKWYYKKSLQFEEEFQILSSGCRCLTTRTAGSGAGAGAWSGGAVTVAEAGTSTGSGTRPLSSEECYLLANRDTLAINWCYLYFDQDINESEDSYKRSELKTIPIKEIVDICVGHYKTSENDTHHNNDEDDALGNTRNTSKILSIQTNYYTLEFMYPPDSDHAQVARLERWIQSLKAIIHFLAIPIPLSGYLSNMTLHDQIKRHYKSLPSSFLAEERALNLLTM